MFDLHSLPGKFRATSSYPGLTTWGSRGIRECRSNINVSPKNPGIAPAGNNPRLLLGKVE